jgi:2-keto-4-pentenoate hydratase/2-oxohepta-3-ene-1,7-dioic acid hydratase in catechol pathway
LKIATYTTNGEARLGLLQLAQNRLIDLKAASGHRLPADLLSFLQEGEAAFNVVREILAHDDLEAFSVSLDEARLLAPLTNPQKIMAIGRNYAEHALEGKRQPPTSPIIFAIYPSAIIGPGDTIAWDDSLTQQVDYEGELAVVIGKTARHVSEAEALDYVAGYTLCNDVSARDLQYSDGQYTRAKSLDTFAPLGPWLVTADEIPDPQALQVKTYLNGQLMQDAPTADMIFSVRYLIAYMSRAFTLYPGDIISTGTPAGVGAFREPPVFMKDGDEVMVEIEGIGSLSNPCKIVKA